VRLIDHLAYELMYVDQHVEQAAMRNAWIEVEALEALRAQIRETRSVLIRREIQPPLLSKHKPSAA